jgi:hypothetical protein
MTVEIILKRSWAMLDEEMLIGYAFGGGKQMGQIGIIMF